MLKLTIRGIIAAVVLAVGIAGSYLLGYFDPEVFSKFTSASLSLQIGLLLFWLWFGLSASVKVLAMADKFEPLVNACSAVIFFLFILVSLWFFYTEGSLEVSGTSDLEVYYVLLWVYYDILEALLKLTTVNITFRF